ncbi:Peroxidase 2 [Triticum urartu]|uniref:Peroxidase 2 n=1 Tax=Triticum urartu TaxID=4572 RepID=M7Y582_TRIUA|nr:Peroxidase 2 [Triticum urartu]
MASSSLSVVLLLCLAAVASAQMSPTLYDASCPGALATIKNGVACKRTVSCADILAVTARDSVVAVGGPPWTVSLGRRDSDTASKTLANRDLPAPSLSVTDLITRFAAKGLNHTDMVALSGAHTIGRVQCKNFRTRLYSKENIDPALATSRKATTSRKQGFGPGRVSSLVPVQFRTGTNVGIGPGS